MALRELVFVRTFSLWEVGAFAADWTVVRFVMDFNNCSNCQERILHQGLHGVHSLESLGSRCLRASSCWAFASIDMPTTITVSVVMIMQVSSCGEPTRSRL
jgi:hypothetical protein